MSSSQSSPSGVSSPRSMTKEMLRNALIQHGIPLPDRSALKEELVRLYQEHVARVVSRQGEFSSDDEQEALPSQPAQRDSEELRLNFKMEEVEPFVKKLSDAELFGYLKYFDISSGPVVASTRSLYESQVVRQLTQLVPIPCSELVSNGQNHEDNNGRNGFSDSDDDIFLDTASRTSQLSRASGAHSQPPPSPVRRQQGRNSRSGSVTNSEKNRRSMSRHTPTLESQEDGGGGALPVSSGIPRLVSTGTSPNSSPSTLSRQPRNAGGTVSYFRERPGYPSTTTSNVLPRKPNVPKDESPTTSEAPKASGGKFQLKGETFLRWGKCFGAICCAILAILIMLKMFSNIENSGSDPGADELDEILASLDDDKEV